MKEEQDYEVDANSRDLDELELNKDFKNLSPNSTIDIHKDFQKCKCQSGEKVDIISDQVFLSEANESSKRDDIYVSEKKKELFISKGKVPESFVETGNDCHNLRKPKESESHEDTCEKEENYRENFSEKMRKTQRVQGVDNNINDEEYCGDKENDSPSNEKKSSMLAEAISENENEIKNYSNFINESLCSFSRNISDNLSESTSKNVEIAAASIEGFEQYNETIRKNQYFINKCINTFEDESFIAGVEECGDRVNEQLVKPDATESLQSVEVSKKVIDIKKIELSADIKIPNHMHKPTNICTNELEIPSIPKYKEKYQGSTIEQRTDKKELLNAEIMTTKESIQNTVEKSVSETNYESHKEMKAKAETEVSNINGSKPMSGEKAKKRPETNALVTATKSSKRKKISPPPSIRAESTSSATEDAVGVVLSKLSTDCASSITLSSDQLTATGSGGYRMVRCTHGVSEGSWYCEVLILPCHSGVDGHCRIGFSTRIGELQGPVGYDSHSFGYRDIAGSRIHSSLRHDNYGESYGPGDVIGMLITLGFQRELNKLRFYKNGRDQGVAYSNLPPNEYCPAVSLYRGGSVRMNFGPNFIFPPPSQSNETSRLQPISDLKPLEAHHLELQAGWVKNERLKRNIIVE